MDWKERIEKMENDGKFAQASRVFAYTFPNASYVQKMQFADRMFRGKAYEEAARWYEECINTPIQEDYPYLTQTGEMEKDLPESVLVKIQSGDDLFRGKKFKAAAERYRAVATLSSYARIKLAECFFLMKNYATAKEIYRRQAQETDDGYLAFMLGECYTYEVANEYAYEHAVYWYQYAYERGCTYVYYPLGIAYQFGYGVEKDLNRAESLYKEGAKYPIDRGNCYCKLGNFCYERGEYEKAKAYYQKAADLNNAYALLNLAIGHLNRDLRTDKKLFVCYLAKSAALGNERANELFQLLKKEREI